MPTKYKRKGHSNRGEWTEEQLRNAVDAVISKKMGINAAARHFQVPATTLRRRKAKNDLKKRNLGPASTLGLEAERKIVSHIHKLQKRGFAPTREDVRSMAFKLAERLGIPHKFNKTTEKAGFPWLTLFLSRNPDLSIRKAEGVSLNRSQGMCRKDVEQYFSLLESTLIELNLLDKPGHIFNMDETGLQLNNKPGQVVAIKGSKNVAAITSGERGETITVIACCSAEGTFIPPACIFKGKNKKKEYEDNLPPGSVVYMSEKSAYINSTIFFTWLKEHFVPRKPAGNVLLIMDGHSSHCNDPDMLEYAEENKITLLCLPSHTTQFLQPLDRAFFKSLKSNYQHACNTYIKNNPDRKITRLQFGMLLSCAWNKSATVSNAVSAFKSTGITPLDPSIIPDYAYLSLEDNDSTSNRNESESRVQVVTPEFRQPISQPTAGCSHWDKNPNGKHGEDDFPEAVNVTDSEAVTTSTTTSETTPGKLLEAISPLPAPSGVSTVKKRSRQLAEILTSENNISKKKEKRAKFIKKVKEPPNKKKISKAKKNKRKVDTDSSDDDSATMTVNDDSDMDDSDSECCVGCLEAYSQTSKSEDWIKCMRCQKWLHECCTKYFNFCDPCGKLVCKTKC